MPHRRKFSLLALVAAALAHAGPRFPIGGGEEIKLGVSVQGRPISAFRLGDPGAKRKVFVIGEIHGDERAGTAIANRLAQTELNNSDVDLWIIPQLNPDGALDGTRQNARGVDLNRNFPWRWRSAGQPFDQEYAGASALSEPESKIAHHLIAKYKPEITIWFHQPLGVIDLSGGDARIERRFARLAGLPTRRLKRYNGSAASWQNNRFKDSTAIVAELPPGRLSSARQNHYADAIRKLIDQTN